MKHTLSVLVEDESGALSRISGLFARRGFNIDSLAVGPAETKGISRLTMVVEGDNETLQQMTKQLNKLFNVLGGGVAGLQAVATAKRLGAIVFVSDIRPAVKEQVESLGARFIELPEIDEKPGESGGYAKAVTPEFLSKQKSTLTKYLSEADVAVCTAQVLGKKAPVLIDSHMIEKMRPGAVVIDLAVSQGGNCEGTKSNETIIRNGVKLIGAGELPSSVPYDASTLYAKNLTSLITPFIKDGVINLDKEDELISGCLLSNEGVILQNKVFEN